jgi:hypothetical protein
MGRFRSRLRSLIVLSCRPPSLADAVRVGRSAWNFRAINARDAQHLEQLRRGDALGANVQIDPLVRHRWLAATGTSSARVSRRRA